MLIIDDIKTAQQTCIDYKRQGKKIAFVPTMGNLHQGHLSLVEQAKQQADIVVVSIFVNPMQFGPNEDFDAYPRTFDDDRHALEQLDVDLLIVPTIDQIYPRGKNGHTQVITLPSLTNKLCGESRPGHFTGVTTVVNILFNLVQPDVAIFGKKDFQQLMVIKRMANDLNMPTKIIGGEIIREPNGLAMSSRNGYLSEQEKDQASHLRATIIATQKQIEAGHHDFRQLRLDAIKQLQHDGFKVDYFEIVYQEDLEPAQKFDQPLLIAAAAWLGQPRLIDNQEISFK
ncbi:MAG: pantoate--beta-alanine ligase [Kangiellaceae bacterium]|jgi:pantoate--beta-alanine ligase|nr:pantoate--beta-alanine ligase [Kangiellaceae bacterium]